jgi:hypothetical protein
MTNQTLAQVTALPKTPTAELKRLWRELFGKDAPPYNRPYLVKRLAYRLQELCYGGLPDSAQFTMHVVLQDIGADELASPRPKGRNTQHRRSTNSLVAGTRLIRDWQGTRHEVTVLPDGYEYAGRRYRSLSAIARAITGTQWNGPAFFGLRSKRAGGRS